MSQFAQNKNSNLSRFNFVNFTSSPHIIFLMTFIYIGFDLVTGEEAAGVNLPVRYTSSEAAKIVFENFCHFVTHLDLSDAQTRESLQLLRDDACKSVGDTAGRMADALRVNVQLAVRECASNGRLRDVALRSPTLIQSLNNTYDVRHVNITQQIPLFFTGRLTCPTRGAMQESLQVSFSNAKDCQLDINYCLEQYNLQYQWLWWAGALLVAAAVGAIFHYYYNQAESTPPRQVMPSAVKAARERDLKLQDQKEHVAKRQQAFANFCSTLKGAGLRYYKKSNVTFKAGTNANNFWFGLGHSANAEVKLNIIVALRSLGVEILALPRGKPNMQYMATFSGDLSSLPTLEQLCQALAPRRIRASQSAPGDLSFMRMRR